MDIIFKMRQRDALLYHIWELKLTQDLLYRVPELLQKKLPHLVVHFELLCHLVENVKHSMVNNFPEKVTCHIPVNFKK